RQAGRADARRRPRQHHVVLADEYRDLLSTAHWDTRHTLPPGGGFFDVRGIKIPVAVSTFAEEIYQAPKSWAEKAYPKLICYNKFPKGTHFAAWEQPDLFVGEMRASFKSLRSA